MLGSALEMELMISWLRGHWLPGNMLRCIKCFSCPSPPWKELAVSQTRGCGWGCPQPVGLGGLTAFLFHAMAQTWTDAVSAPQADAVRGEACSQLLRPHLFGPRECGACGESPVSSPATCVPLAGKASWCECHVCPPCYSLTCLTPPAPGDHAGQDRWPHH